MGNSWRKNFVQGMDGRTEDEDMVTIPYPALELGTHVTFKTTQVGCVIGYCIVAPVYRRIHKHAEKLKQIRNYSRQLSARTAGIGFLIGPALTCARIYFGNLNDSQLRDRCYRLRYNKKQLFMDRATVCGGAIGLYCFGWHGFVLFVNLAVGYTFVYNRFFYDRAPRIIRDRHDLMPQEKPDLK